jgi:hypothetical protein
LHGRRAGRKERQESEFKLDNHHNHQFNHEDDQPQTEPDAPQASPPAPHAKKPHAERKQQHAELAQGGAAQTDSFIEIHKLRRRGCPGVVAT